MINLQQKLKEYVDKKSIELLAAIFYKKVDAPPEKKTKSELTGFLKHKDIYDLGEIFGPMDVTTERFDKRIEKRIRKYSDEDVGYDESGFLEIYKLVDNLLKENSIAAIVSEEYLVENIFEWLLLTYRKEIENISLSDYLVKECIAAIQEYKIYIPILHLDSDKEFYIGNVHFLYLTEEYIKRLSLKVDAEKRKDYIDAMLHYKGLFMGACVVKAEKERAITLAINFITFSVDILRIVSPTVETPEMQIFFDVDFRNIHQVKSDIIMQPTNEDHNFTNQFRRKARPFEIRQNVWDYMNSCHLGLLSQFAVNALVTRTELEALIRNAIQNFSKAIANHDLHERVAQIFTVLESLLLPNDSSAIIDSVCKYLPKLVSTNLKEREKIMSTVKEMYKVRSAMMHHAKKNDFETVNLTILQKCTKALILKFIQLTESKKTKVEILKEIDDLINRA